MHSIELSAEFLCYAKDVYSEHCEAARLAQQQALEETQRAIQLAVNNVRGAFSNTFGADALAFFEQESKAGWDRNFAPGIELLNHRFWCVDGQWRYCHCRSQTYRVLRDRAALGRLIGELTAGRD